MLSTVIAATILSPTLSQTNVVGASLFKNGYAVMAREATIPKDGELWFTPPSGAVLGTFWLGGEKGTTIESAVLTTIPVTGKRNLESMDEILLNNIGKLIKLIVDPQSSHPEQYSGKLLSASGQIIIFEDGAQKIVIPKNRIQAAVLRGDALTVTTETKSTQDAIRLSGTPGGKVVIYSLQRGLTWVPAYRINLVDDKKLVLISKATILNDLVDLHSIEVRLITGFPNIAHLGSFDPMSVRINVNQIAEMYMGAGVAADLKDTGMTGQMMRNSVQPSARDAEVNFAPMPPNGLEGFQAQDLFFYRQKVSTLKTGERGSYILFQNESPYKHVYTLDIPTTPLVSYNQQNRSPQQDDENLDVWHEIQFKNTGKVPFTTGTALVVENGETLGQDTLKYGSVGAEAWVKITKALDIQAQHKEEELERVRGAIKNVNNSNLFDQVTVKGTVELVNTKSKVVQMKVKHSIYGEVTDNVDKAEVTKTAAGLRSVNMTSRLTWNVSLKAGEKRKLTFSYKLFVPSY